MPYSPYSMVKILVVPLWDIRKRLSFKERREVGEAGKGR